jgi:hypothetical protein
MEKTIRQIVTAFEKGRKKKVGDIRTDGKAIYLFKDKIAEYRENGIWITLHEWSPTLTRNILNTLWSVNIFQINGKWYLNGSPWDGSWRKAANVETKVIKKGSFKK